jgi:protein ImuB
MAQPFRKHALTFAETLRSSPDADADADADAGAFGAQLWLAVWLPGLALQAVEAVADPSNDSTAASIGPISDSPPDSTGSMADSATHAGRPAHGSARVQPSIVVEPSQGRLCVVAADDSARSLGIEPGLNLNAAFAFSGSLRVLERSPRAERVHLEALAAACRRLTPAVSLEPPESLLLEVRASLKLFGGLSNLRKALTEEIEGRGFTFQTAAAPTPLAALWLARHRGGEALSRQPLLACSSALPLHVTRWPAPVRDALKDMGVATIGDCLKLPRDGFARRMGKRYLEDLDKALGRQPDPRRRFEPPGSLSFEAELDGSTSLPVFVDAAARMTKQLAEELRVRQAQVRKLQLMFRHRRRSPTVCRIELLEASGDERRFTELLSDKLERLVLPAPAMSLRLRAGPLLPARLRVKSLFKGDSAGRDDETSIRLVERLRGRFGARAVHGLGLAAEHRPEKAWIETAADPRGAGAAVPESPWACLRPLWLLRAPQRLLCVDSAPCLNGTLRLQTGPERIESGWWDGRGVSRDYFAATTERGEKLWVYRDRVESRWYLHGYFG